jgi:hypothetical protein
MAFRTSDGNAGRRQAVKRYLPGLERPFSDRVPLRGWHAIAAFALASLLIRWPWLAGSEAIPWDAKAHFQPQIQFLAQSLADHQSPFWTPYVFSGHPQIADPQAMIFSPPFLVLSLLASAPGSWAIDATLIGMVFLAGCALMLWFRDQGWHWAGGLIAALVFCYGASMAWRIQHTGQVLSLAYLPIAMLCLDRALLRRSVGYGMGAGFAAACIVLGRDQVALLAIYFLLGLTLWRLLSAPLPVAALRSNLLSLSAGVVTALVLIAVPVTLTLLLTLDSNRPSIDVLGAGRGSLHPALLLTLISPDLFGASSRMAAYWGPPSFAWPDTGLFLAQNMGQLYLGAIPALLLLTAALQGRLWAGEIRFFTIGALAALLYALGWYTPVFHVLYEALPGVALFRRPADATFLAGALAAILAGYAAHRLFEHPAARLRPQLIAAAVALAAAPFAVAIALGIWLDQVPRLALPLATAGVALVVGAGVLLAARPRIASRPLLAAAAIAAVTAVDLAYNNGPGSASAQPRAMYEVLEPHSANATIALLKSRIVSNATRRDRVELAGLGFHWPNASLTHQLENTLGYNPLRLHLYSSATGAEDHVGLPEQRKFSPLFPSYRSTLANLLGLRFIVTGVPIETMDGKLNAGDLPLVAHTADGYVYENASAFDRVLFATAAQRADFDRLLSDGRWPDADLHTTVLLEDAPETADASRRPGRVGIARYRNAEVALEVDSPDGGWVVLNDPWHPWWFAEVDGEPTVTLKANVLFRAVAVPPGKHAVRFSFRPLAGAWNQLAGRHGSSNDGPLGVHAAFSAPVALERRAGSNIPTGIQPTP